eukprot:15329357-Ditylum_brightwellii.AAC.1
MVLSPSYVALITYFASSLVDNAFFLQLPLYAHLPFSKQCLLQLQGRSIKSKDSTSSLTFAARSPRNFSHKLVNLVYAILKHR